MSESKPKEQGLSAPEAESMVKQHVDKILAAKPGEWGVVSHNSLVWRVMLDLGMPEEAKADFAAFAEQHGLFTNAAQFRQWEYVAKKLPESAGKKRAALLDSMV